MTVGIEKNNAQDVSMPTKNMVCPVCQGGWGITNSYDVHTIRRIEQIDFSPYIGISLYQVKRLFDARMDGFYLMGDDITIRNDKHIDNEEHPKYKTLKKNQEGWCSIQGRDYWPKISWSHEIEPGDFGYFNVWRYYHKECNRIKIACDMRDRLETLFKDSGFPKVFLESTPNGYCPCDDCAPWFDISTPYGKIAMGWRKRVLSISCQSVKMSALFACENVTMGDNYIHAWGYDKVKEYLVRIRETMIANCRLNPLREIKGE